jgi:HEAT repeat protein
LEKVYEACFCAARKGPRLSVRVVINRIGSPAAKAIAKENDMKRYGMSLLMVGVLIWGCCLLVAGWGQAAPAAAPASLEQAFKDVAAYEFGKSRESLTVVSDAVRDSQGKPDERKVLEKKLLSILKSKATLDGKQFACRELSIIGADEAVPALGGMLSSKETADMARYALERIPGAAADKALIGALGNTSGVVKIGIINSLGARQCAAALGAIGPLATNKDKGIAEAAIAALGRIGGPDAIKALAKAKDADKDLRAAWADAYLLCADKLRASGENEKALKMYEGLVGAAEPDRIRVAAFEGRVLALGEKGVPVVVEALQGDNAKLQAAATFFVRQLAGKAATDAFVAVLPKLAPAGQALLVTALADRGDAAALAAVTEAAKSKDAAVHLAGLAAMGKVGGASCVPGLAQVAATGEKAERDAARASLDMLRGADVDAAIVAYMKKCDPAARAELARSLAARNAVSAVPALLETAKDADEKVREESFKALGGLASEKELPALVDLLIAVEGKNARGEAEKAVVAVSKTIADEHKRAAAVLGAMKKAKSVPAKCSMMTVLGQIGDNNGLKTVYDAAKGAKAEVKDAAIRSLAGWPNIQAIDPVMDVAKRSKDETQRVLALRGLLRLLDLPSDRSIQDTLKSYDKAMKLAAKADEKKMVLGSLANVKHLNALVLVEPFLADEELKQEAGLAARKIKVNAYKVSASANQDDAKNAIDNKMDTRWHSGAPQKPDMFFMVDQGAEYEVSKIVLDTTPTAEDYPRGCKVFISNDVNNWGAPVAEGKGSGAVTEISFAPKSGRYIKIVQTGTAEKNFWSIHELKIESKSKAATAVQKPDTKSVKTMKKTTEKKPAKDKK